MRSLKTLIVYWIICIVKIIQEFIVTDKFKKSYSRLQPRIQKKIDKALRLIKEDFHHPSLNTKKQKGKKKEDVWEGYVDRKYRFLFELEGNKCYLLEVGPHKIVES